MVGKTLYKAKIRDGKIEMFSRKIVEEKRKYYYFTEKLDPQHACYKSDVGVVIFLTKREALDYLIKELEHLAECGETYLKKIKEHLKSAQRISREVKN